MALLTSNNTMQIVFHINGTKEWEKKQNMAHVQYTYIVAYVYHSVSFVLSACEGRCALAPRLLAMFVCSILCT